MWRHAFLATFLICPSTFISSVSDHLYVVPSPYVVVTCIYTVSCTSIYGFLVYIWPKSANLSRDPSSLIDANWSLIMQISRGDIELALTELTRIIIVNERSISAHLPGKVLQTIA